MKQVCPACGSPECVGDKYCGYTGKLIEPEPVPATANQADEHAVAEAKPKSSAIGKLIAIVAGIALLAGAGYLVVGIFVTGGRLFFSDSENASQQVPLQAAGEQDSTSSLAQSAPQPVGETEMAREISPQPESERPSWLRPGQTLARLPKETGASVPQLPATTDRTVKGSLEDSRQSSIPPKPSYQPPLRPPVEVEQPAPVRSEAPARAVKSEPETPPGLPVEEILPSTAQTEAPSRVVISEPAALQKAPMKAETSSPARAKLSQRILKPEPEVRLPPVQQQKQPKPAYSGLRSGIIIWSGRLEKNGQVTINGDEVSAGTLNGQLPGVPVIVDLDTSEFALADVPAPSNEWKKIVFRSRNRRHTVVTIRWTVIE